MQRQRALGPVEEKCLFPIFNELRFAGLDDSCCACVARFSRILFSSRSEIEMKYLHFS